MTASNSNHRMNTRLIHLQTKPRQTVNPPIERGSTLVTNDLDELYGRRVFYGRHGHTTHTELAEGLCLLEQAEGCFLTPNGLSACTGAIEALAPNGSHILYLDSLYGPTAKFLRAKFEAKALRGTPFNARWDIAEIARLITPQTSLMVLETPGSLTFEIPDLPALCALANKHGIKTIVDNTWSAGICLKPLTLGADVSIQALTKYVCGHADALGGAILSRGEDTGRAIDSSLKYSGVALGPEDAYLLLRGLRTLPLRLKAHDVAGQHIAQALQKHDSVHSVLHPALRDFPDHALWKRDFSGSSGLFSVVLQASPCGDNVAGLKRLIGTLNLFKMGFSWGGYESLLMPCDPQLKRPDGHWSHDGARKPGPLIRLHIGQEDIGDLMDELDVALRAYLNP